eukprot:514919-Pleurochrysis_carterae.AAC.3
MPPNVDLDAKAQIGEPARRVEKRPQPMQHNLQLELVKAVDKRDEVELAKLRMPLHDGAHRRSTSLLQVMKEDNGAVRQRDR